MFQRGWLLPSFTCKVFSCCSILFQPQPGPGSFSQLFAHFCSGSPLSFSSEGLPSGHGTCPPNPDSARHTGDGRPWGSSDSPLLLRWADCRHLRRSSRAQATPFFLLILPISIYLSHSSRAFWELSRSISSCLRHLKLAFILSVL